MNISKIAAAVALAASAAGANALQIDFTGTGTIAGSQNFASIAWDSDSAVIKDIQDAGGSENTVGTLYLQNKFSFGTGIDQVITQQLILPILISAETAGNFTNYTIEIDASRASIFKFFLDKTPNVNSVAGTGYGDLNGGSLDADQVEILAGEVYAIDESGWGLLVQNNSALKDLAANRPDVDTRKINGSTNLLLNVTSQDTDWVVSDIVGAGIFFDLSLQDLAFSAPYATGNLAAAKVVNVTPNFGTDKIQDNACVGTATCDFELAQSGNSLFYDKPVPEPTGLALAGLGLTLLGFARRRNV